MPWLLGVMGDAIDPALRDNLAGLKFLRHWPLLSLAALHWQQGSAVDVPTAA